MFLVNGTPYGGSFSELANTAVIDIKSIKVYNDAAELAEFGSRGLNGVIDIKLK